MKSRAVSFGPAAQFFSIHSTSENGSRDQEKINMTRVLFKRQETVANIAKALKKHIRQTGGEAKQSECMELCARMFGYRNFNDLIANLTDEPSAPDADVSAEEFRARAEQYMGEIMKVGFTREEAWDLICSFERGPWFGFGRFVENGTTASVL